MRFVGEYFFDRGLFTHVILTLQSLAFIIEQHEIKLFLLEVGSGYLDVDIVAKAVTMIATATYKTMILFVKVIKVIGQIAHRHEAFTQIVVELYIESPFGNTGDYT